MGRELWLTWVGRRRRDAWESLCDDYRERLERSLDVRETVVKPAPGDGLRRLAAEAEAIRATLPERRLLVALDRRGEPWSSRRLADELSGWLDQFPHPLVFVLGSDLGLDASLLAEADRRLSLGPLTLPHQLARLVLCEQLYRALSLRSGIKYHRDPL